MLKKRTTNIQTNKSVLSCLKDNAANQLCSRLLKDNREIIMQDEQIKSWKKKHGKKVQHSILGKNQKDSFR